MRKRVRRVFTALLAGLVLFSSSTLETLAENREQTLNCTEPEVTVQSVEEQQTVLPAADQKKEESEEYAQGTESDGQSGEKGAADLTSGTEEIAGKSQDAAVCETGTGESVKLKGTVFVTDTEGNRSILNRVKIRIYKAENYNPDIEENPVLSEAEATQDGCIEIPDLEPGEYRVEYVCTDPGFLAEAYTLCDLPADADYEAVTAAQEKAAEEAAGETQKERDYFVVIKSLPLYEYREICLELEEMSETQAADEPRGEIESVREKTEESLIPVQTSGERDQAENTVGEEQELLSPKTEETTDIIIEEDVLEKPAQSMTLSQLSDMEEDMAGAATQVAGIQSFQLRMQRLATGNSWSFDAYYVNEEEKYETVKTQDFNLKYQMTFHTSRNIPAGSVEIRIPSVLLQDRDGNPVNPTEIAVPRRTSQGDAVYSRNTPFNYYQEGEDLVFYNYRDILAGTSTAWQVLYKQVTVMDIVDKTRWELEPTIEVTDQGEPLQTLQPLTGEVDTTVSITGITQTAYHAPGKSYTPGLYTQTQVETYIAGTLPDQYVGDNFYNYRYVVWNVVINGTATQPWNLEACFQTEVQGVAAGEIVGWSLNRSAITAAKYIEIEKGSREKNWKRTFYVVTAYPKDQAAEGTVLENQIDVRLTPADAIDPVQEENTSSTWSWANYNWNYSGDEIRLGMGGYTSEPAIYSGWLEMYRYARVRGEDLGSFPYVTRGICRGYELTHVTDNNEAETLGTYKEGTSYRMTLVNDFLYAYPGETGEAGARMLDDGDYYFSSVTVNQTDTGYDVWEDREAAPEKVESVGQELEIYAMFAGSDSWELVDRVPWDESGVHTYTFNQESLSRQPWRIKAVYETINYETECQIDVTVRMRQDSPAMEALGDEAYLRFEGLCGISIEVLQNGIFQRYWHEMAQGGSDYQEPGLEEATQSLYGVLLPRYNAYKTVTELIPHAESHKTVKSSNDPEHSRVILNYSLTAYDGYQVYSQAGANYLEQAGVVSPGRNQVAFYDLLPAGVRFDPSVEVKAGRITSLSGDYQTQPKSWDASHIDVVVDPEKDIIDNYRGTGRTMVVFHIRYVGEDSAVYTQGNWMEGWGISFQAYYDWKDVDVVHANANISAFLPEDAPGDALYKEPLRGTEEEVAFDDGVVVPEDLSGDYAPFADGDLNGDGITDIRHVLYAKAADLEDIAVAGTRQIQKLVRSDADRFGAYQTSAVVAPGKGYTYDITVTASGSSLEDIVIFDRLENASTDRENIEGDSNYPFDSDVWYGTFQSIETTALEELGIEPKIYYNTDRNAPVPAQGQSPAAVLTQNNGWYPEADFPYALSEVRAVAVDVSEAAAGGEYVLENLESLSVQIKMQAPADIQEGTECAYNHPSYFSTQTGLAVSSYEEGNSVRVRLGEEEVLEVVKEFAAEVPEAVRENKFEFTLYEEENGQSRRFANKEYQLWRQTDTGWEQQTGRAYATDGSGTLTLKAGEKAVFTELPDAGRIRVEEEENPFWKTDTTEIETEKNGTTVRTVTMENTYRPVLYAQKETQAVPEGTDVSQETFTFQLLVQDGEGKWKPLSDAEFWYVDRARTDGGIPSKVVELGTSGMGYTDQNGKFTIRKGEIVALFPGEVNTAYQLKEVEGANGEEDNWICLKEAAEGTVPLRGVSVSLTNIYRWKDLLLTKTLTHQDPEECTQPFTFQIKEAEGDLEAPVSGKEWVLLNIDGSESDVRGTLSEEGTFTCACAGRTVKIKGLEAGKTYSVTETESGEFYRPVNTHTETEMPFYSISRSIEFTNDYLKRPLSVTKMVSFDQTDSDATQQVEAKEFEMTASVNGALLAEYPYTLTESGGILGTYSTDAKGRFTLKNGQTATFEEVGVMGDAFTVSETPDADYPQIYPAGGEDYAGNIGNEGSSITLINGTPGGLVISKKYVGTDQDAQGYIQDMQTATGNLGEEPGDSAERMEAAVSLTLEVTDQSGNTEIWPEVSTEVTVVDQLRGTVTQETWNGQSALRLMPWKTVILDAADLEGIESYRLWEAPEDQHWMIYEKSDLVQAGSNDTGELCLEICQSSPKEGEVLEGRLEQQPAAEIINEISSVPLNGTKVTKRMTADSTEVAQGAELVWRVEQFDGTFWNPAEGVRYLTFDGTGTLSGDHITCDRPLMTGTDGKIVLVKTDNGYPFVRFMDEQVKLNQYGESAVGDFRIVEVTEESDKSWGLLTGYEQKIGMILSAGQTAFNLLQTRGITVTNGTLYEENAVGFFNSNQYGQVKIEKQMDTPSQEEFIMIVEQVISTVKPEQSGSSGGGLIQRAGDDTGGITGSGGTQIITEADQIVETRPAAGVTYTVYDTATEVEIRTGVIGTKGEIALKAGQYALLNVPDKTIWTVSEKQSVGYYLKNLSGGPTERVTKISDNLMVIQAKTQVIPQSLDVQVKNSYIGVGQTLDKDNFIVNGIYSDGSIRQLTPEEYTLSPETSPDTAETMEVTVRWTGGNLEATVTLNVVNEITLTRTMVDAGVIDARTGKSVVLNTGDVTIPEFILWEGSEYWVVGIENSAFGHMPDDNISKQIIGIHFPDSIRKIGDYAFRSCENLRGELILPKSLESIGYAAFSGCSGLTGELVLPENLESIGDSAFSGCSGLTGELVLPENLESIGDSAFYDCGGLTGDLVIPEGVTSIGEYVFYQCSGLTGELVIPEGVTSIGIGAFGWCSRLTGLVLPESLDSIGYYAFEGCDGLTGDLVIPNSVTYIGWNAFYFCRFTSISVDNTRNAISGAPWGWEAGTVTWLR